MQRFGVFCLCITLVWASPLQNSLPKKTFSKDIESRIFNGELAVLGQFPWQAAVILSKGDDDDSWFCGGTVISDVWMLTSAHCVEEAWSAEIYTGLVDMSGNTGQLSVSSDFIIHEGYDNSSLVHNIALIKLSKPLTLDDRTGVIPLSSFVLETDVKVLTSGWGITRNNATVVSQDLNFINIVTMVDEECSIFAGIVCAESKTNETKGICSGDNGGPLVFHADTNPVLVGVASWSSSTDCESGGPSGFSRIGFYRDWIRQYTAV